MEVDAEKPGVLKKTVDSMHGYDELLLIWNDRMGYAKPINKGLKLAKGDYIIVMNDDLIFQAGDLRLLCNPDAVTSPVVNGREQGFWGCCFCMPRWVYEKTGGLDERYTISYFDDDDFLQTLKSLDIPMHGVPEVQLTTEGGRTLHSFPDRQQFFEENRIKFQEKWGILP